VRFAWLLVLAACSSHDFDRRRFDDIVARVRNLVVEPGHVYRFRVDAELTPRTLHPIDDDTLLGRGDGRGLIVASMTTKKKLAVSIETRDDGHAGELGYMFQDPGMTVIDLESVAHDSQHEKPLGNGWLAWRYDLD
jgi:hypothetical protein